LPDALSLIRPTGNVCSQSADALALIRPTVAVGRVSIPRRVDWQKDLTKRLLCLTINQ